LHFTKLRLAGFKSFVDPAEFGIAPGLTGIVGPNGCGKSNLVEALQWAMGETSARRLRGGEMDDVIFGGTTNRPARDLASVTIWLDNSDRRAPAPLNDHDELEVERRIGRGKGSTYRVNGREMRARDVQLLFADAASGAGSSALVGQGRIGWLINAKPSERRVLLEEAAGIGGLQARRHDSELRLAATEQNLSRLDDVAATLATQIDRLRRQARQAERYRALSEELRGTEALVLHRHFLDRKLKLAEAEARLAEAEARVRATEADAAGAGDARSLATDAVPPLREASIEAMRQAERLALELQSLKAEEQRVRQQLRDATQRLEQIARDLAREQGLVGEAEAALARLAEEASRLETERAGEAEAEQSATAAVGSARSAMHAGQQDLSEATSRAAQREAERVAVQRRLLAIEERRQRARRQQMEAEARTRELDLLAVSAERLAEARAAVTLAETEIEQARAAGEAAERALRDAETAERAARQPVQAAERQVIMLKAEIDALTKLVQVGSGTRHPPVLDRIKVAPGLETALGAVLGDDLLAALDPAAAIHWADLPPEDAPLAPLPAGAEPLAPHVEAPPQLARSLARIGIVPDAATGAALHEALLPGQRLVSRDGAVWRWDGLARAAGAPTAAAIRLAQRNRLAELATERQAAESVLAAAEAEQRAAAKAIEDARTADRQAREAQRLATSRAAAARTAETTLVQQAQSAEARRQAAVETLKRLEVETAEIEQLAAEAEAEKLKLPDPAEGKAEIAALTAKLEGLRETERLHQRELDRVIRDAAQRRGRLESIAAESRAWRDRAASAGGQRQALEERQAQIQAELAVLAPRPAEIESQGQALGAAITAAKSQTESAARLLAEAETRAREAEVRLGLAQNALAESREHRVRTEAGRDQAAEAAVEAERRIVENFECSPEDLATRIGNSEEPLPGLEARLEKLKRDRDAIGPVNLMAEAEMAEMTAQRDLIETESADLRAAVARLRQAIQQLNKEGRERLLVAFEAINAHFGTLFQRLYGGGKAYLELTQHENDPLQAGIEIMASPPGKKLQTLSLLSGGERALTAIALVFAMFLTNPAPICVLDEVDAPLDDANVERFCQLVREISTRTGTRFLMITHHRVSMARVDRLYGVTMTERGVSRLVSVDLVEADRLRETA
jgi:chromosome segregation protein